MSQTHSKPIVLAFLFAFTLFLHPFAAVANDGFSTSEKNAIESIIREYLLKNPDLLLEMSEALEQKQEAEKRAKAQSDAITHKAALFENPRDFVVNPGGQIPVVEFFDYNCGYCKRVLPAITRLQEAQKDVRFIYKELPILSKTSVTAAKAAIAAKKQGKYLEYHNALMQVRGGLDDETIMQTAEDVGLDVAQLKADMEDEAVDREIAQNRELARTLNIRGTPTLFVADSLIPGAVSYDDLASIVNEKRSGCAVC